MTRKPFNKFRIMKYAMVCAALLLTAIVNAQTWHFGPKLDANYAAIKGNGIRNKFSPGLQIGGFAEYSLNKHWSIQPELLYTWSVYKKGSDFLISFHREISECYLYLHLS